MNTKELGVLARGDPSINRVFKGVLARDQLPQCVTSYPSAFIVNTDDINSKGEHWVSIFFESPERADYFDSFGLHPHGALYTFPKNNATKLYYNKKWLQSPTSDVCGLYCIYYLYWRCRGIPLVDILNHFNEFDWVANDKSVARWTSELVDVYM